MFPGAASNNSTVPASSGGGGFGGMGGGGAGGAFNKFAHIVNVTTCVPDSHPLICMTKQEPIEASATAYKVVYTLCFAIILGVIWDLTFNVQGEIEKVTPYYLRKTKKEEEKEMKGKKDEDYFKGIQKIKSVFSGAFGKKKTKDTPKENDDNF